MSRLFISHSSKDKIKIEKFVDFLVLGMGIAHNDIFCTSLNGTLLIGEFFMEQIRNELKDCEKVICFITQDYLKSITCISEMGAAWYQKGKIIPIVVNPLTFANLENTPLKGLQILQHENSEDLMVLYDELKKDGIARNISLVEFNRHLKNYTETIQIVDASFPDECGFFEAQVVAIRNTPSLYRCYKLDTILKLKENTLPGETHWIFYKAGMYEDLSIGDTIRFSIDSTELRQFHDLRNARNIYPSSLVRL